MSTKIKIMVLAFLLYSYTGGNAQRSMDSLFIEVPSHILPLLELHPRMDLVDLYNYQLKATTENIFSSPTTMLKKDSSRVQLQLTDVSQWEMKVLEKKNDTIFSIIHTIETLGGGSHLSFYDRSWQKISKIKSPTPQLQKFFKHPPLLSQESDSIQQLLPIVNIEMNWSNHSQTPAILTMQIKTSHLEESEQKYLEKFLRPILYQWTKEGELIELAP